MSQWLCAQASSNGVQVQITSGFGSAYSLRRRYGTRSGCSDTVSSAPRQSAVLRALGSAPADSREAVNGQSPMKTAINSSMLIFSPPMGRSGTAPRPLPENICGSNRNMSLLSMYTSMYNYRRIATMRRLIEYREENGAKHEIKT